MEELKNNYKEFVNQLFNRKQRKIEKKNVIKFFILHAYYFFNQSK